MLVRGDIITMGPERDIVRDGAVLVRGDLIVAVGSFHELQAQHPREEVHGGPDDVITPGYVNAHQHLTGDRLVRSAIPDDIDSNAAVFDWALPLHGMLTEVDDELSATLSLVEAVGNGITTTIEAGTVAHPERVAAAFSAVGARGVIGRWGWDVGDGPGVAPASEVLAAAASLVERHPTGSLVEAWIMLVGHDLMSDALAMGASDLARELGTRLSFHLSPDDRDAKAYLARTGRRPAVHLHRLGVLGPHVVLAHGVHLDDAELDVVLDTDTAVVACPWAYLRLAQGVTAAGRHRSLLRYGGRVALGCDSENASDAIDVLRQATLFVGLERDRRRDPHELTARHALELATIRGAEAVGMADRIGSLEPGKQADLVVHDTSGPQWVPRSPDPVRQLVWASDGRSVRDVLVAGRWVVRDSRCATVDLEALRAEVGARSRFLLERLGHVGQRRRSVQEG